MTGGEAITRKEGRQEPTDVLSGGENADAKKSGKAWCGIKEAQQGGVSLKPECLV